MKCGKFPNIFVSYKTCSYEIIRWNVNEDANNLVPKKDNVIRKLHMHMQDTATKINIVQDHTSLVLILIHAAAFTLQYSGVCWLFASCTWITKCILRIFTAGGTAV